MVEASEIDGRSVSFRHEPGEGPALICLHGSADNHHMYDRLLDALPGRERFAINMPGRAGTDGPALGSVAAMAEFLSRFVESEVKGDYLIAGHSVGGAVAIEHALGSPPAGLRGIILLASGARLRVHPMILQLFEQAQQSGKEIPPLPFGLFERSTDPALIEEASANRELTPIATGARDWRAADTFDRMHDLGEVRVPALIVSGTDDALTPPKYAEYMAAHIPKNELHMIEGAGHMLPMERAEQVAESIEGFVQRRFS